MRISRAPSCPQYVARNPDGPTRPLGARPAMLFIRDPASSKEGANHSAPAPGEYAVRGDADHGARRSRQAEVVVLGILGEQQIDRPGELVALAQDLGAAVNDDVAKPRPLLVILVDDQRDPGVLGDVAQPAEITCALGLGIDGGVDPRAVEGVAPGHDQRPAIAARGGEPTDAGRAE